MLVIKDIEVCAQKKALVHRLMSGSKKPIYVLGRNKYAQRVSHALMVEAFIDDFTTEKTYFDRPIIRMADLPSDCIVISCVVAGNSLTALDRLSSVGGGREVSDYFTLSRLSPGVFTPVDYCAGNRQDILENTAQYELVYNLLSDDISKDHFQKVVNFRLNMDVEYMRGFALRIDEQYFEDFLPHKSGAVFVDGGGYDGKTTQSYVAWNPTYRQIYYFEPTPAMMETSRRNLANLRDVKFLQKGLFGSNERLRFDASADQANALSPMGQNEIEVVRLDDEVQESISFIKLDIEGAEYEALNGAAEHIRVDMPTMAICIYHNQRDFWRIPSRILKLNDRYSLFVRHYTQGIHETVMFFVPKSN